MLLKKCPKFDLRRSSEVEEWDYNGKGLHQLLYKLLKKNTNLYFMSCQEMHNFNLYKAAIGLQMEGRSHKTIGFYPHTKYEKSKNTSDGIQEISYVSTITKCLEAPITPRYFHYIFRIDVSYGP